jgi:hypothetical protein
MPQEPCSERSELTRLFARRVGGADTDAEGAVLELVHRLQRSVRVKSGQVPFEKYLALRKVKDVSYRRNLGFDGQVEPLGSTCEDGFRIVLNRSARMTRNRFTLAHELCHTFFYEYVPEIKFSPHSTDPAEERLCNLGAAELLMPAKLVRRIIKGQPICLDTLKRVAAQFHVSNEAMVLRLNELRLWRVELSLWMRLTNGKFAIERIVGGKTKDWEWMDTSEIARAWEFGTDSAGLGMLLRFDQRGERHVLPVRFDLTRCQERVCVLWGQGVVNSHPDNAPLFKGG